MKCYRCEAENLDGKHFCSDCGTSLLSPEAETFTQIKTNLGAQLDRIVEERFKDQRLVAIEITEGIVKRLTDWAKLFAFLFAVPLGLLIISLSTLGITTYKDFKSDIEKARLSIMSSLDNSKKEADAVATTVNTIKERTKSMQTQAEQVQALFKSVASLSTDVKVLTGEEQTLSSLKAQNKSFGIDADHHTVVADWSKLKNAAIDFVFVKATQGSSFVDPAFASRWNEIKASGLVRGAYHTGVGGDPVGQADRFLKVVAPVRGDLIALDFEPSTNGADMTLEEAMKFASEIHDKAGRYPIIYGGSMLRDLLSQYKGKLDSLAFCDLWIARYSPNTPTVPNPWQDWRFWQMSDSKFIGGIGPVDYNVFNGTRNQLIEYSLR